MSTAVAPADSASTKWEESVAFAGAWGGRDQLARVFGAVRTSLADDTLPPLPADVCALMEVFTWAQVADVMRIAESSQTHDGLAVPKSAMGHQMLRLVLGGDPATLSEATPDYLKVNTSVQKIDLYSEWCL